MVSLLLLEELATEVIVIAGMMLTSLPIFFVSLRISAGVSPLDLVSLPITRDSSPEGLSTLVTSQAGAVVCVFWCWINRCFLVTLYEHSLHWYGSPRGLWKDLWYANWVLLSVTYGQAGHWYRLARELPLATGTITSGSGSGSVAASLVSVCIGVGRIEVVEVEEVAFVMTNGGSPSSEDSSVRLMNVMGVVFVVVDVVVGDRIVRGGGPPSTISTIGNSWTTRLTSGAISIGCSVTGCTVISCESFATPLPSVVVGLVVRKKMLKKLLL